jgi:cytochrome c-type biogenesis protein CcmH/NrfF
MRAELRDQVNQGKNRDEIIAHFMAVYGGQQFLASPIDKGFNRLAWLVPYSLAGTGVFAIGIAAYRWSRRKDTAAPADAAALEDPALDQRLDDELRDLD